MTNMHRYISMRLRWTMKVSTTLSFWFPVLAIVQVNWIVLTAPLHTLSSGVTACVELSSVSIQHIWQQNINIPLPPSKWLSITRLSINIFLLCLTLSKHDKGSVFLYIRFQVHISWNHTDRKHTTKNIVYCIIGIRYLAGKFGRLIPWWNLWESIKICRFKTFRVRYFA